MDLARGIALILMIVFHFLYDLNEFYGYKVPYNSGVYWLIGKISGSLFILVSGISTTFSGRGFKRALKLLAVAGLITLATHLYNPDFGIKYGILHFLGTCVLLYPLFQGMKQTTLALIGAAVIFLGRFLGQVPVENNYLFLMNMTSDTWVSADYYPLFPWLGVFLFGIALAKHFYPTGQSITKFPSQPLVQKILKLVIGSGQHTLFVYLIHQPVLLLLIGLAAAAG